jgi:hypothetical protein
MSYPINYPTPQGANVQIFRGGGDDQTGRKDWVKPQGASFVWFTLIGAGGGGGGGFANDDDPGAVEYRAGGGGASGGVTNFMCPAFLLPDMLQVAIGVGGNAGSSGTSTTGAATNGSIGENTIVEYQQKDGAGYELVIAYGGGGGVAAGNLFSGTGGVGTATSVVRPMLAAGFYNATVGQNGADGSTVITTDGLTFVMGGNGSISNTDVITGYYGYTATTRSGYSQLSPIPLAIPNRSTQSQISFKATPQSIGCGGNGGGDGISTVASSGKGGDGLAIIVTW